MNKSLRTVMHELHDLMDHIVKEGNEVDYIAVLDFADNLSGMDVERASSKYRDADRPLDFANIKQTIGLERKSYRVNPYDEDKLLNGRTHLYRFSPSKVEELVLMFACYNHGDVDTFRAECHRHIPSLIEKLKELQTAS